MKYLANSPIPPTEKIDHTVINFLDDSNSALTFENVKTLNIYITAYMKLMIGFYNMNMLRTNESKPILF